MFLTIAELTGRNKISRPFASSSGQRNPVVFRERLAVQTDPTIEAAPAVVFYSRQPLLDGVGTSGVTFPCSSSGVPDGVAVWIFCKPTLLIFLVPFSVGSIPSAGILPTGFRVACSEFSVSLALLFGVLPIILSAQLTHPWPICFLPLSIAFEFPFTVFQIPIPVYLVGKFSSVWEFTSPALILSSFLWINQRHYEGG